MSIEEMFKKKSAEYKHMDDYKEYKPELLKILKWMRGNGEKIAIWGAGLKGMAFLKTMDPRNEYIDYVIDMNRDLHGTAIDKYRTITDYESVLEQGVDSIFIMNMTYFADNYALLREHGFTGRIVDMDEWVENNVPAECVIENKPYEVKSHVDFDLAEVHKHILIVLDEIDRICKKHNLTYFLSAGTALGAIRHKGFVPWDDDADIGMPRKDFETFRAIAKEELGEQFYFQHMAADNDFYRSFDQVGLLNSSFVVLEHSKLKMHHGIHVDIFPFDKVSGEEALRRQHVDDVQKYRFQLYFMKHKTYYESRNPWKQFVVNYRYYLNNLQSFKKLNHTMEQTLRRYEEEDTGYVADLLTHYKKIMFFKETDIYPVTYVPFEDREYPVPCNSDAYLTMMYGDYMTPPPEGKRNQRHRLIKVSCTEAYEWDEEWRKQYKK